MAALSEDSSVEWEAAQWVARRMGDEPFDKAAFDAWLVGEPRRKALYDVMWQRVMGPNMDAALDAFARQRRRSVRAGLAGGIVAVLALFVGYKAMPSVELFMAQPQEYAAADDTVREVALEDGTRLTLAGGARVRVRYGWHVREVELARGTVFADVVHDTTRPFRIDAGNARVTDLGTRFEVVKKSATIQVTVESGSVRFGANGWFGKRIDLAADQAAVLSDAGLNRVDDPGRGGIARWRAEWVEYHDAPMKQVIADLESVAPLPIRIADDSLADLRVSGRIRLSDPVRQIDNLSIIHDFTVEQRDGVIVLSKNRSGS